MPDDTDVRTPLEQASSNLLGWFDMTSGMNPQALKEQGHEEQIKVHLGIIVDKISSNIHANTPSASSLDTWTGLTETQSNSHDDAARVLLKVAG